MADCHDHDHHHHHHHDEEHPQRAQHPGEMPAIFSQTLTWKFTKEIPGQRLVQHLKDWVQELNLWSRENSYHVGHIKTFITSPPQLNLWLASTGWEINVKGEEKWQDEFIGEVTVHVTAIVFGPQEQELKEVTLNNLKKQLVSYF